MVNLAVRVDVLTGIYEYAFGRHNVYDGFITRVGYWNPYVQWEVVLAALKGDRDQTVENQQQSFPSIGINKIVRSRFQ